jgi:hypothetical protein
MTILAISGLIRPMLEPHLPAGLDVRWFMSAEEAKSAVADAEIGWFDMNDQQAMAETLRAAKQLKWLNSIYAGLDFLPMDVLIERGITVTNGAGINALTIAEYVVMGMLNIAKGYREVVHAQDRHEWLMDSPGKRELFGSKALLLGMGAIGSLIAERLAEIQRACNELNAAVPNLDLHWSKIAMLADPSVFGKAMTQTQKDTAAAPAPAPDAAAPEQEPVENAA